MEEVESGIKYTPDLKGPIQGLLGVHSRYGLHTRAVTVYRDPLTVGFSHIVTSMTAPVASGWSGCRLGLATTGKRRLSTAHAKTGLVQCSKYCGCDKTAHPAKSASANVSGAAGAHAASALTSVHLAIGSMFSY
jgi:hypothetical protein